MLSALQRLLQFDAIEVMTYQAADDETSDICSALSMPQSPVGITQS